MWQPDGRQDFVDVNITGTLNLLEEAASENVAAFVYTSTTSVLGDTLVPPRGEPTVWVTEDVIPVPKNIYGVTKAAAEDLCQLFARNRSLRHDRAANLALLSRTGRQSETFTRGICRRQRKDQRVSLSPRRYRGRGQRASARGPPCAVNRLREIHHQRHDAFFPRRRGGDCAAARRRWSVVTCPNTSRNMPAAAGLWLPASIGSMSNDKARAELGWQPRHDFRSLVARLKADDDIRSPLAREIGSKGYHDRVFGDGPYPVGVTRRVGPSDSAAAWTKPSKCAKCRSHTLYTFRIKRRPIPGGVFALVRSLVA